MEILLFRSCLKGADNHGLLLQAKESHLILHAPARLDSMGSTTPFSKLMFVELLYTE